MTETARRPAFPDGLALVRPRFDDVPAVTARLAEVLASGQLTNGRHVRELEDRIADRLQVPYVVAVSSCTAGLMLVYQALGVRGDVVMPSHTFSASGHAVRWAGGRPRFADVEPSRGSLDPASAAGAAEGAAALSATHVFGHPAEAEALESLAARQGIPLVFDSAHALGSVRRGRPVGGFGDAEVFSMSPTKVTVAGEGGIVATRRADVAEHVRVGRNYGNPGDYNCRFPGLNARLSELHAVLALASLERLDERIPARVATVDAFEKALGDEPGVRVLRPADGDVSTYKDLTVEITRPGADAGRVQAMLEAEGVDSRRYFWPPVHRQDAYAEEPAADLPVTEDLAARLLTVPLVTGDEAVVRLLADVVAELVARSAGET